MLPSAPPPAPYSASTPFAASLSAETAQAVLTPARVCCSCGKPTYFQISGKPNHNKGRRFHSCSGTCTTWISWDETEEQNSSGKWGIESGPQLPQARLRRMRVFVCLHDCRVAYRDTTHKVIFSHLHCFNLQALTGRRCQPAKTDSLTGLNAPGCSGAASWAFYSTCWP